MKITGIKTYLMQAGSPGETAWAKASDGGMSIGGARQWLFLHVETDAGIAGVGECSGWPRVVETAVQDLAPLLIGEDPTHIQRLWNRMHLAMMGHGMTGTVGYGAMSGIEMALWDIKGKALDTPVWNLLGGKVRSTIRAYAHASTPANAVKFVGMGYTALKAGGVHGIVEKVANLRATVGPDVDLMVDLHGPPWMPAADVIEVGKALEPYNLLFLEDPVAPEDIEGLKQVRRRLDVALAAGERHGGLWGVKRLLADGLIDVVQPDTGRAGGIGQMMKVAHLAEAHFAQVAPHSGSLGPVAEYAAVHVMAAISNALILERFGEDWPGRQDVIASSLELQNGHIVVPDRPGLGVELNLEAIARYPATRNVGIPGSPGQNAYEPGTFDEHVYQQTRWRRASAFQPGDPK